MRIGVGVNPSFGASRHFLPQAEEGITGARVARVRPAAKSSGALLSAGAGVEAGAATTVGALGLRFFGAAGACVGDDGCPLASVASSAGTSVSGAEASTWGASWITVVPPLQSVSQTS